jgi:hypothetical protein
MKGASSPLCELQQRFAQYKEEVRNRESSYPPSKLALRRSEKQESNVRNTLNRPNPKLITAYLNTEYRIASSPFPALKIGQYSEGLSRIMAQFEVNRAVLITGDNPFSTEASSEDNEIARTKLYIHLSEYVAVSVDVLNVDPAGGWPDEVGYLALGLEKEWGREVARSFGQIAFVYIGADAVPELVLTETQEC